MINPYAKIIQRLEAGRYINELIEMPDGTYSILHGEKDMMYGANAACWSTTYEGLTLAEANRKFKEITND